jgi:hypothetical protein
MHRLFYAARGAEYFICAIGKDLIDFILVCVPDPVCQTRKGNSASRRPVSISRAAAAIAEHKPGAKIPRSRLTAALARLTIAKARTIANGMVCEPTAKWTGGALRLRAPVMRGGHLDRPETVGLDPRLVHVHPRNSPPPLAKAI